MIDEPTVFPSCVDERAVGGAREGDLTDAGDGERVGEAEDERGEHDRDGG